MAEIAEIAGGLLLMALGVVVLRFNRDVAEAVLGTERFRYDDRVTLLDLDRAARLRKIYDRVTPVERFRAGFLGVWLLVAGGALFATGVS
jgi:hypothetical protein